MKNWIIFLIGLIIFESIADIFAKEFSLQNKFWLAIISILFYIIANSSWLLSLRENSTLTISANIFSVSSGIIAFLIGIFIYNESITIQQFLGLVLGFISLILLF